MSGSLQAWYGLRDLEALGAKDGVLAGELELAKLKRLASLLHTDAGSVKASLRLRQRGEGWLEAELDYDTWVELVCQRCLEPFRQHLAGQSRLAIVDSESAAGSVPPGVEPVELDAGRLSPAQLIEDELIVSIPLVPKHPRIEDCGSLARDLAGTR